MFAKKPVQTVFTETCRHFACWQKVCVHTWVEVWGEPGCGAGAAQSKKGEVVGESSHMSLGLAHSPWLDEHSDPWARCSTTPWGCLPCAPLPHQYPVSSGRGSSWKCPPLRSLSLGVPLPFFPSSGHLFIYLFIYLSYLLVFIDNWKSGAFISVAQQGQLGLPPTQPPVFWGAAGSTSGEGCLWVPTLPSPFCEGVTPVPAGKAPGACPLPAEAQSPRAPSSVHPYLLTRPPGTSLSSSHWICCFQFLEMVGGARTYECHYGEIGRAHV